MTIAEAQVKRKKLVRLPITKQQAVDSARKNLTGTATPSGATWCYKWCRRVLNLAGASTKYVPIIATAKLAYLYYQTKGWEWTADREPNLGDLILWVSPKHGPAGHIEMYIGDWKTAGNSSLNITSEGDKEARGIRPLNRYGDWKIIRPPYKDAI